MAASLLLAILSVVVLVEGGVVSDDLPENRIIDGYEVDIAKVPWQVSLQQFNYHMCGGSIISPRWVLTAAHCTDRLKASDITIRIGSASTFDGGNLHRVEQIVDHEEFSMETFHNDISLLKTATVMNLELTAKNVSLPALGSKKSDVGTKLLLSGWGQVDDGRLPEMLRAVDLELHDYEECAMYAGSAAHEPTQLCAGSPGKGSCCGDSGSPLVKGNVQVGIAFSVAKDVPCGTDPGLYTDVAAYRDWIHRHTNL